MEATAEIPKLPPMPSMTPEAIRSRARRAKPKSKNKKANRTSGAGSRKRKPKSKAKIGTAVRSERLDMRLTKAEKAKIIAKAKKTRRTVTSLVIEAIEKIK